MSPHGQATMTPQQLQEQPQLESRVTALEIELAQWREVMANFLPSEPVSAWWLQVAGSCEDDPDFDEAILLGEEWRNSAK